MRFSDISKALPAGSAATDATTAQTLTAIDTLGFDACTFLLPTGSTVAAIVEVQVSEDNSTWLTVSNKQLALVADTVMTIDCHRLDWRYARLRITPASETSYGAAIALLSESIDSKLPLTAEANRMLVANKPAAAA